MAKAPKLDISKYKDWARLNSISKLYVNKIQKTISSLESFDAKVYPNNSTHSSYDYRILAKKLANNWIQKWLEIFQYHISSVVNDIMPQIKPDIFNVNGISKDRIDSLITSTIETEFFSMFLETVEKYLDEIQIYKLMKRLEEKFSYTSKGFKIQRSVDIYPIDVNLIMGCVYRVNLTNDSEFKIEIFIKSKCINFKNVSDNREIQNEIKEKVNQFLNEKCK